MKIVKSIASALSVFTIVAGAMIGMAGSAQAGVIAFGFSGGSSQSGQNVTYGFKFTPVVNVFADSLGFFDLGSDGLSVGHRVGIWTTAGALLTSTTVNTGNSVLSGPVVNGGQYRFTGIADFALAAGTTYVLGGAIEGAGDIWFAGGTNISTAPALVTVASTGEFDLPGFIFPSRNIGNRYAPVSFTVRAGTVPEPATLTLFGLGLAGLGFARRRKAA